MISWGLRTFRSFALIVDLLVFICLFKSYVLDLALFSSRRHLTLYSLFPSESFCVALPFWIYFILFLSFWVLLYFHFFPALSFSHHLLPLGACFCFHLFPSSFPFHPKMSACRPTMPGKCGQCTQQITLLKSWCLLQGCVPFKHAANVVVLSECPQWVAYDLLCWETDVLCIFSFCVPIISRDLNFLLQSNKTMLKPSMQNIFCLIW